jgi:hypothetical protein
MFVTHSLRVGDLAKAQIRLLQSRSILATQVLGS